MRNEYGRSLIEIIGVLAITGIMGAAAITVYSSIRNTQARTIAAATLEDVAKNVRILMSPRGTYDGVSVSYLVKAGALHDETPPIGRAWSVTATPPDGETFEINLDGLSEGECDYFAAAVPTWAGAVVVNGYHDGLSDYCISGVTNQVTFIVR